MLIKADNQPVDTRFGDAIWITDFITPNNPDVILKYRELTKGLYDPDDIAIALWNYVANLPYVPSVSARLIAGGKQFKQHDTWFFPAEAMLVEKSNCANRSFILASLLKNYLTTPGEVYCVVGNLSLDGIGAHAWVQVNRGSRSYIMETTLPNLHFALIPTHLADAYMPKVYFDEKSVYTVDNTVSVAKVLESCFGLCAIDFLESYLCKKCLELEGV